MNRYNFWDMTPFSPLEVNRFSEEHVASETSVDFQRTTRHYIPQYGVLQNYSCENIRYNETNL
jgi:hypothetical protein